MEIFNSIFVTFLPYFCILTLSTIALIFSERAGIINLGINGVIVIGATTYMIFAFLVSKGGEVAISGWMQIPLFLISAIGGLLFSVLHGFATIKLKANQVISGVALNILAPALTIAILFLFGTANKMNYNVGELAWGNAANDDVMNVISLKVLITLALIIIAPIIFSLTKYGLRLKSIGENPQAADVAGINVNRMKWQAILISGVLAGIAGAIYISSLSSGNSFRGNNEGLGYLAIAIMIVGRWKILPSVIAVFVFSLLFSLGLEFKTVFPHIEKESIIYLIKMIPYLFTILVMLIFSKQSIKFMREKMKIKMSDYSGPKAAGEPYYKNKR